MIPEKHPTRVAYSELRQAVFREVQSNRARRLLEYLMTNDVAMTHEISRDTAIGNVSDAACLLRPVLYRMGWTIAANLPDPPLKNRFNESTRVHEWRLAPLR